MAMVFLVDMAKVLSGVDQRHRGLVDAPAEFTWWGRTISRPSPPSVRTTQVLFECLPPPRMCAGYGAAALVAITGVAGGEREAAMGIAAAVSRTLTPSPRPLDHDGWSASTTCFLRVCFIVFVVVVYARACCFCWCCCR